MKTYDTGARTFGSNPTWKSLWRRITRWIDRERELISLRNVVGMMSEARRADAAEYEDMRQALRAALADSRRLRWLTEDHADPEVRAQCRHILESMAVRSYSGTCLDIDAAMDGYSPPEVVRVP